MDVASRGARGAVAPQPKKITVEEYYEPKCVFERLRSFRYGVV